MVAGISWSSILKCETAQDVLDLKEQYKRKLALLGMDKELSWIELLNDTGDTALDNARLAASDNLRRITFINSTECKLVEQMKRFTIRIGNDVSKECIISGYKRKYIQADARIALTSNLFDSSAYIFVGESCNISGNVANLTLNGLEDGLSIVDITNLELKEINITDNVALIIKGVKIDILNAQKRGVIAKTYNYVNRKIIDILKNDGEMRANSRYMYLDDETTILNFTIHEDRLRVETVKDIFYAFSPEIRLILEDDIIRKVINILVMSYKGVY